MKSRTWTSILAYTSARILMFGCAVILLYLAGARGVLLLALGLVISALASYILLNKQRAIIADRLNGTPVQGRLEGHRVSATASTRAPRPRTPGTKKKKPSRPTRKPASRRA